MIFDASAGIKHILHTKVAREVPQGQVCLEMWDEAMRGIRDQLVSSTSMLIETAKLAVHSKLSI